MGLEGSDQRSDNLLDAFKRNPASLTKEDLAELTAYLQVYAYEIASARGEQAAKVSVEKLLSNGSEAKWTSPYAGTKDAKNAYAYAYADADAERAEVDGFFNRNF